MATDRFFRRFILETRAPQALFADNNIKIKKARSRVNKNSYLCSRIHKTNFKIQWSFLRN